MSVPLHQLPEQQPSVWQPTSVEEAMHLKHKWGDDSVLISGGTWLRTRWENGVSPLPQHLISLGRIPALSRLTMNAGGQVHIGPALCLADLMGNELMRQRCSLLVQACSEIAAPSVRNLASIGGNVVTRTGDLIPVLLVMDAQVVCSDGQNERVLALNEWLESPISTPYEVMTAIVVPTAEQVDLDEDSNYEFYLKVGRREAFTPSVVTVAGRLTLRADGKIEAIALAAGGGSAVPARFKDLEAAAIGQPLSKGLLQFLHKGVSAGFDAVADDYAGVSYRKQTAANLIVSECYRAWRKGGGADAPRS
ncbi:carbon-monoxide dehydrogenase medium subunit [Paenibacillus sp. yr247]|uniref:FAD binding domain-containing protein n=1 Tax=Paenibacillus sp. yr247 TaxID=1761880 RepID=UPI00087FEFBD|nr:FAD binding domain-containing protein [Paenibacillus sp. yr247]SDO59572.1 carbon-monoxide dehydrogenase medium subunit [Paenibacillus sp. yr247]